MVGNMRRWILCLAVLVTLSLIQTDARIIPKCEMVKHLQNAGISRSLISNWLCLIEKESGFNTNLVTGPKVASSYNYGIFQISSLKYCARGRVGGICNIRCENLADDNVQDDIICAKKIHNMEGFKHWDGWMKGCKNKPLPNIGQCRRRRRDVSFVIF